MPLEQVWPLYLNLLSNNAETGVPLSLAVFHPGHCSTRAIRNRLVIFPRRVGSQSHPGRTVVSFSSTLLIALGNLWCKFGIVYRHTLKEDPIQFTKLPTEKAACVFVETGTLTIL